MVATDAARRRFGVIAGCLGWLLAAASGAVAANVPLVSVIRVLKDRVRVSVDEKRTLHAGTRLEVVRGGRLLGELEVDFAGEAYATCRIVHQLEPFVPGDLARLLAPKSSGGALPALLVEPLAPLARPLPADAGPRVVVESRHAPSVESAPQVPQVPQAAQVSQAPQVPQATQATLARDPGRFKVRQVLAGTIYLDGGREAGLVEGSTLRVLREGDEVARLQVAFVARSSASCKVIQSKTAVVAGDVAIAEPGGAIDEVSRLLGAAGAAPPPQVAPPRLAGATSSARRSGSFDGALSGSIGARYQMFRDASAEGRDTAQYALLVNLEYGQSGAPFRAQVRGRTGERMRFDPDGPTASQPDDRIYEMSLVYQPPEGRLSLEMGRLLADPRVGFDYLDGVLAELRVGERSTVGGFYGARANYDRVQLEIERRAYGAFYRFVAESPDRGSYAEFVVGATGEYEGSAVNREYVSLYGRQGSGSRWSLFENAEIDLNRSWRGTRSGSDYQISNILLTGTYTVSKAVRLAVTFDQLRRYRTLDDIDTPEELFDDALREGARLSAYLGSGQSLRANLSVGLRRREGGTEENLAYAGSVYKSDLFGWRLLAGVDYSAYAGDLSSGERAGLRLQKYFRAGHDVELTVGASRNRNGVTEVELENRWIRLAGTVQLPWNFYLLGEYELTTGDDLAGERLFLQVGYRVVPR